MPYGAVLDPAILLGEAEEARKRSSFFLAARGPSFQPFRNSRARSMVNSPRWMNRELTNSLICFDNTLYLRSVASLRLRASYSRQNLSTASPTLIRLSRSGSDGRGVDCAWPSSGVGPDSISLFRSPSVIGRAFDPDGAFAAAVVAVFLAARAGVTTVECEHETDPTIESIVHLSYAKSS